MKAIDVLTKENQRRDEDVMGARVSEFMRQWRPEDPYQQNAFEGDLYSLVAMIMRVAQEPLVKQMAAAMALVPPAPIFMRKDELK